MSSKKLSSKERYNIALNTLSASTVLAFNSENIVGGVIKRGLNVMEKDLNSTFSNKRRIRDYDGNQVNQTTYYI